MGKKGTVLNEVAQFLGPLLKRRPARTRARRICLEDPELLQTELLPATPYKAVIDPMRHQVVILPADEDDGTLPHVARTKGKACIDLRAKQVLDAFETVTEGEEEVLYVQVSVHKRGVILHQGEAVETDLLVVEGFAPDASEGAQKRLAEAQQEAARKGRITDIRQFMAVKRVVRAQMGMDQFREILAATGTYGRPTVEYGTLEAISGLFGEAEILHQPTFRLDTPVMEEYRAKVRAALQAVSLFSGAGLLDIGATLAGFEVVFALEVDADACETYRHNFGNHIVQADIRKFDLSKIPHVPVMFGGPPCKGFSTLNPKRSPEYHTNDLVDYFIEAVRLNPACQVFVIENVSGFLTMDGGSFLERVKRGLSDFAITAGVLRALDFGSPQDRSRAIVIGARRDGIGEIPLPEPTTPPDQYRTVRWALQGYHSGLPNARDYSQSNELTKARIRAIKPGQNWRSLPDHLREGLNGRTFFHKYYRLLPDAPSITLGNLNKSHVIGPYDEDHFLDVRQGARLFGMPDKFVFKGGLKARMEQVGNGVCVHLGYHLFRHIREYIERYVMFQELGFQP